MSRAFLIDLAYIAAAVLFVYGLKGLQRADLARRGNQISAIGMLLAAIATVAYGGLDYQWIVLGIIAGAAIGGFAARTVTMTGMPEMVALFNGSGGLASLLVGWAEYHQTQSAVATADAQFSAFTLGSIAIASLIGGVTFTGSIIAWGKLAGKVPGPPMLFPGQQVVNVLLVLGAFAACVVFAMVGETSALMEAKYAAYLTLVGISVVLGILSVISIGGGDMPVVVALLNSYSGLAACATGFIIVNKVLIVSGALVGASGLILATIMCKAMNRSLANVLFSGFGSASTRSAKGAQGEAKVINTGDAFLILEASSSVVFVPGYGMAVAQAQHAVRELADMLEENGCEVRYAIHPVAGRMPGHMNVLLAEASVPYEQLVEPGDVNPKMETVDVCMVIGANDVVNPAAREDEDSPIYGMPIIDADRARTTFVLKRSLGAGYAGIGNPLFFKENTRMLLGDAKTSITALLAEFKVD
ncbi:MAG TPA: NAD(P)(+) transhydrogenase (Re/Si-specific) subunit beta [Acidobacteriota bacterium]|nr:NAD(P)(+) transhydrogenase (Re/Si-specific) subunit beta [Acidobacteriota bacterium]